MMHKASCIAMLGLLSCVAAQAAEHVVQPGQSITKAINQAAAADTILIQRGHYPEHLVITKPLHLKGIDRPTLDGGNTGDVIRVKATDVTIEGFIISNSGADLTAQNAGIYLEPGSDRAIVRNNTINYTLFGLALMEVRNQTVRNNRAWGNSDHGIMLRTIQDSVIENNVVADNGRGFFIYDAEYNVLRNNLIIDNQVGVHLWAGSIHNEVEGNDLIQNREQIKYVASHNEYWGIKTGNYWSNYIGWDRNGDGVGDVPYEANDLVDQLTWKYPVVKLLLNSPAVQTLRLVARQFPLLRAPSIVDRHPRMLPFNKHWSVWLEKQRH